MSDDETSTCGTEQVGCYVLEREGEPDRYFSKVYPALSEDWPDARATIAWWYVDTDTDRPE